MSSSFSRSASRYWSARTWYSSGVICAGCATCAAAPACSVCGGFGSAVSGMMPFCTARDVWKACGQRTEDEGLPDRIARLSGMEGLERSGGKGWRVRVRRDSERGIRRIVMYSGIEPRYWSSSSSCYSSNWSCTLRELGTTGWGLAPQVGFGTYGVCRLIDFYQNDNHLLIYTLKTFIPCNTFTEPTTFPRKGLVRYSLAITTKPHRNRPAQRAQPSMLTTTQTFVARCVSSLARQ